MFEDIVRLKEELETRERFTFYDLLWSERLKVLEKIAEVLESRSEIELAVVYGSFVKRGARFRDIDVAVYLCEGPSSFDYLFELMDLLESVTGYRVDVVVLNDAPAYFGVRVLSKGVVLFERRPGLCLLLYKRFIEEKQALEIYNRYSSY